MPELIRDVLNRDGVSVSFEFSPPKTDEAEAALWQTLDAFAEEKPDFVSVTYGAGGSTRDRTLSVVERIEHETSLLPVAHMTAVDHSITELQDIVTSFKSAGIRNLLALRGDPPGDPTGEWVKHPEGIEYASSLVDLVHNWGDFCVGVAAFPYKHPRSTSVEEDTQRFVEKCRRGVDYAITQMFFDADDYLRLRDRVTATGCDIPILAGLMPVLRFGTVQRAEQLSGAPFPAKLGAQFDALRDDENALREFGLDQAAHLAQRLIDEGVPGLHFITFNRATATREVLHRLRASLKPGQKLTTGPSIT